MSSTRRGVRGDPWTFTTTTEPRPSSKGSPAVDIGPTELIIALVIILLLFGGKKLPEIARGLGRAQHEFKEGMQNPGAEPSSTASTTPTAAPSTPVTASTLPPGE